MIYRAWIESENQPLFIGSESYDQDGLRDVHGKTDLKFFVLETDKQMTLKLGMLHWGLWPYQYCSNDGPWLTFAALQQVLIRFLTLYYGKKVERWNFRRPERQGSWRAYKIVSGRLYVVVGATVECAYNWWSGGRGFDVRLAGSATCLNGNGSSTIIFLYLLLR